MTTDTYYHQEDVPPKDADTQVELYQQAREVIKDGQPDAQRLYQYVENNLHRLFVEAENTNNEQAMELINTAWERVQRMAAIMGQQGAALTGANQAIDALTGQRDEIAKEMKDLLNAIDSADVDHPQLIELVQSVQEWEMEYTETYAWDMVTENITERLDSLIRDLMPEGGTYRATFMIADDILSALRGNKTLDNEQEYLLLSLVKTFDIERKEGGV